MNIVFSLVVAAGMQPKIRGLLHRIPVPERPLRAAVIGNG
jgi:hypothetical protein